LALRRRRNERVSSSNSVSTPVSICIFLHRPPRIPD
jgi:hypothetical protein